VPDTHTSSEYSFFYVSRLKVFGLPSVVDLVNTTLWMPIEDDIYNFIILFNISVGLLLLYKIDSHCPMPIHRANPFKSSFYFLFCLRFTYAEDEAHRKGRVFFGNLLEGFIEKLGKGFVW
jgi:hypothetical protein